MDFCLEAVDNLLRCGICFEYFNIAMIIPQCSHNYCSLCIRKFLSYKTQCPTCRVAVTEPELKNNRLLDDLVKSFNSARQQLFQLVLDSPPVSPPTTHAKLSIGTSHAVGFMVSSPLKQDKQLMDSFLRKESTQTAEKKSVAAEAEYKDSKIKQEKGSSFISTGENHRISETEATKTPESSRNPEKPSTSSMKVVTKVDCPVCGVAIPEQYINKHLDSCLTRDEKKDSLRSSGHKRKPLSKVVYNLLSDRDLKKKLKEHGLSIQGTRRQLVKRHQEFVHVYNAQCDSLNPKPVAEIIKELENNEKIRSQLEFSKTGENSMTFTKDQTEKEIDEIHSCYREENIKEECTALICVMDQLPKTETSHFERIEFHNLAEDQRSLSPAFSQSSGSTSSSSSDILRDPQGVEMCSESSDNTSFPDVKVNKGKSRRPKTPESSQVLPRSKRRKT
ncbi:E3 ubiquitin-protein ligase RAD18 isoform X4 [Alligator sinensis]|uniref:RING-type E3 ubiquitin transferase n=1 Tax=Alligator sinensis TaxID=38654 RepID=A0A3Q0GLF1_ALLSI|nr:E3 ubiquitin-protein ligase RAD18 isoform X4 [Alligator sinensis]